MTVSVPSYTANALRALASLAGEFLDSKAMAAGAKLVERDGVPPPFDTLLVHEDHMTTTLQTSYGRPVELRVLQERRKDSEYRRMILLTLQGSDRVVEFGIVRLDLQFIPEPVRAEILERKTPLGDVLIRHHVLRRVEPRWFLHFQKPNPVLCYLQRPEAYGRVAVIHCNGLPAVELLEVVGGNLTDG